VLSNGSQFTFTGGLSAISATVSSREVRLTTPFQSAGLSYQVTVATSVKDTNGTALDSTATTAAFFGYQTPAKLLVNEVNPNITGGRDLVELFVVTGGSVNQMTLVVDGTTAPLATLPNVTVAAGDIIVVHLAPSSTPDAPASETTSKSQYARATYTTNYDTAWDFLGGASGISYSHRVLRVKDVVGNTQDAVAFVIAGLAAGSAPSVYPSQLQALQAEGLWQPMDCGGALCTYSSSPSAVDVSATWGSLSTSIATSVQRLGGGVDTNSASDWYVSSTSSFGSPNP
jgi:hypothetical protein